MCHCTSAHAETRMEQRLPARLQATPAVCCLLVSVREVALRTAPPAGWAKSGGTVTIAAGVPCACETGARRDGPPQPGGPSRAPAMRARGARPANRSSTPAGRQRPVGLADHPCRRRPGWTLGASAVCPSEPECFVWGETRSPDEGGTALRPGAGRNAGGGGGALTHRPRFAAHRREPALGGLPVRAGAEE
jgi:hypothetical protein